MSKKAGADAAETRARLLQAAGDEFLLHGFQKSSLRRICDAAGVTTGALYFFFDGKDDLFNAVISGITVPFMASIRAHYRAEEGTEDPDRAEQEDLEASAALLDVYWRNRQACDILVAHLNHPAVRAFIDDFVEYTAQHYTQRLNTLRAGKPPVDPFAVHWFSHLQMDSMLTLISHGFTREEAAHHAKMVVRMLRGAFATLVTAD